MRTRIWNNLANIQFKAIYTGKCARLADRASRACGFILAVASASSVAAWAIWQKLPWLWTGIVAGSQLLHLARPYLPFLKHDKAFLEMRFAFEHLYLDYEKFWIAFEDDRLSVVEAEERFYALREREIAIEEKYRRAPCPRLQFLMAAAEQETTIALVFNFPPEDPGRKADKLFPPTASVTRLPAVPNIPNPPPPPPRKQ